MTSSSSRFTNFFRNFFFQIFLKKLSNIYFFILETLKLTIEALLKKQQQMPRRNSSFDVGFSTEIDRCKKLTKRAENDEKLDFSLELRRRLQGNHRFKINQSLF